MKAAGDGVTVSVLQNVYAEEMVHQALPEAKVDQYESVDLAYQALNSGRADAVATDMSSLKWLMKQNPGKYVDAGHGWNPQTYSCAVKRGDADWLNFVNTALHEAMTGVDYAAYASLVRTVVRRSTAGAEDRLSRRAALTPCRVERGGNGLLLQLRSNLGELRQSPPRARPRSFPRARLARRSAPSSA